MRIAIREKLGLSKPRNSGFDRGGAEFRNRDSSSGWRFVVGGGREGRAVASSSPFGVGGGWSVWMRAEFSLW